MHWKRSGAPGAGRYSTPLASNDTDNGLAEEKMTIDMDIPFAEFAEKHLKSPEGSKSAVERLVSLRWSQERPTEPGWYWYEDDEYGPAPVEVEWTGFIHSPNARQLEVTTACGEDTYWPTGPLGNLGGKWAGPIVEPEAS